MTQEQELELGQIYHNNIIEFGRLVEFVKDLEKQAAINALSKAERMEEIEQKEPNPFAVQSLDKYDSGELDELLDVVRMAINGKVPTRYESLDFWSYRLRDAIQNKQKND